MGVGETADIWTARKPADLGKPPSDSRARAQWARETFVALGCAWYQDQSSASRQRELEDLAVSVLKEHHDVLPSLSALKRATARVSFLPSLVEDLWMRAFPPTAADRARHTREWEMLVSAGAKVASLRRSGRPDEAEALRRAAVAFFNKYLDSDDVGAELRRKARLELAKG